jgi:hypothetical protein
MEIEKFQSLRNKRRQVSAPVYEVESYNARGAFFSNKLSRDFTRNQIFQPNFQYKIKNKNQFNEHIKDLKLQTIKMSTPRADAHIEKLPVSESRDVQTEEITQFVNQEIKTENTKN